MQQLRWAIFVVAFVFAGQIAAAQSVEDESDGFTTETVLSGLDNPWGIVIRAGRDPSGPYELFVAESGAGRVIRISTDQPNDFQEAIVGFPIHPLASSPAVRVGPLGLAFLTRTKLIVTGGRRGDNNQGDKREVRVYVLSGDNSRLAYDAHDHSVSKTSASDLLAITANETAAFITLGGDSAVTSGRGLILKADIEKNRLETLRPFVSHGKTGGWVAPAGISLTPSDRPQFLVVADQGSFDVPNDSRLSFYSLENGRLALSLSTRLHDIMGLAYSPSGQLYAVDCAWHDAGQGGVYRLDDARQEGRQVCRAVKIASVARGIALAFAPDGALYVTALGENENAKQGTVIKITGEF